MKKTFYCSFLVFFMGATTTAIPQYLGNPATHVIEAPNFKGKDICVNIIRPSLESASNNNRPLPIVKTETEIGHQEADYRRNAKHTITFAELGTISIDEEIGRAHV